MSATIINVTSETYHVQRTAGRATIVIRSWQQAGQECGELLINSSYGSWGYLWERLEQPLKAMLADASFDALMGKLMAGELREFDFMASLARWSKRLRNARHARTLTADQYREAYDESCSAQPCGAELFLHRLQVSRPLGLQHPLWDDLASCVVSRTNPRAIAFWLRLWTPFVEQLRVELQAPQAILA